jgi:hypothetical protein
MSTIDADFDPEALISRLAGPLLPGARAAFRQAAEEALARLPCCGEGAAYRAVAALQRQFFDAPSFSEARWGTDRPPRPSRLKGAAPIANGGDGRCVVVPYRSRVVQHRTRMVQRRTPR